MVTNNAHSLDKTKVSSHVTEKYCQDNITSEGKVCLVLSPTVLHLPENWKRQAGPSSRVGFVHPQLGDLRGRLGSEPRRK